jgi:hypothetical protein
MELGQMYQGPEFDDPYGLMNLNQLPLEDRIGPGVSEEEDGGDEEQLEDKIVKDEAPVNYYLVKLII